MPSAPQVFPISIYIVWPFHGKQSVIQAASMYNISVHCTVYTENQWFRIRSKQPVSHSASINVLRYFRALYTVQTIIDSESTANNQRLTKSENYRKAPRPWRRRWKRPRESRWPKRWRWRHPKSESKQSLGRTEHWPRRSLWTQMNNAN